MTGRGSGDRVETWVASRAGQETYEGEPTEKNKWRRVTGRTAAAVAVVLVTSGILEERDGEGWTASGGLGGKPVVTVMMIGLRVGDRAGIIEVLPGEEGTVRTVVDRLVRNVGAAVGGREAGVAGVKTPEIDTAETIADRVVGTDEAGVIGLGVGDVGGGMKGLVL